MKDKGKMPKWHQIFFEFFSEKSCSKCVNPLIMRFNGSVSENLRGDFLPDNRRLHCHFWSDYLDFDARSILSA